MPKLSKENGKRQRLNLKQLVVVMVVGMLCTVGVLAEAATYYIPDDFSNLHAAFSGMSGGDTLIIRDGVYTGDMNVIDYSHYPPDGFSESYTVIKAENGGEVSFDGENIRQMFYLNGGSSTRSYMQFEGIVWCNSPSSLVSVVNSNHIKFLCCGAYDAGGSGKCCDGFSASHSSHVLFEDCWAFGAGRKNFYIAKFAEKVICRRCVVRHDRHYLYDGQDSFMAYDAKEVEFQNCISIDGDRDNFYTSSSGDPENPANFVTRNTDDGYVLSDVYFRGCISIGNDIMIGGAGSNNCGVQFIDCIHWDSFYGTRMRGAGGSFNHCTFGNIYGNTTWSPGCYLEANSDPITNSIIYGVVNYYGIWGGLGNDYNSLYNNNNNYRNISQGPHDFCSENGTEIDPITGSPGNDISALKYLLRIEDSSNLDGAASDGGDIGATVLYKIGRDGTLWGEEGYNEVTTEPLWPFPNEDLIKEQMSSYYYTDGNGEIRGGRGFCANDKQLNGVDDITLTSYIWEYLGNPIPTEIYGGEPLKGDLNNDTLINIQDIQACVNHILGTQTYAAADVNADSSVDVLDVQGIVNIILGS